MQITKNFKLEELVNSSTAKIHKLDNTPPQEAINNLTQLAIHVLLPVRDLWGKGITINSGYRSPELNKILNGATNSLHMKGQAADITTGSISDNKILFDKIINSGVQFDLIIDESKYKWIHISYNDKNNRRQILHL